MSLLIVYSSGREIQYISHIIKDKFNADIIEVKDLNRKRGFFNNIKSNFNALRSTNTEISPETIDLDDYNLILVGCPSTMGNASPAIKTLINNCDFSNKNVILYTTTKANNATGVLKQMKKLVEDNNGVVVNTFIQRVNDKSEQDLMVNTIKLLPHLDIDLYI